MKLDIIKLAKQSSFYCERGYWRCTNVDLKRFAALVLEEAAAVIEAQDVDPSFKNRMAYSIRALKEPE